MKLKTVGYYKEMVQGRETDPSIYDFINKENADIIKNICNYLNQGIAFIVSPGTVSDVIHPENGTVGISSSYTDGVWLWPGDLAYYVKKYSLKLPEEFVDTMQKNNWKVSYKLCEEDSDIIEIDGINVLESVENK